MSLFHTFLFNTLLVKRVWNFTHLTLRYEKNQRGFTLIYEVSKGLTKAKRSLGAVFIFLLC